MRRWLVPAALLVVLIMGVIVVPRVARHLTFFRLRQVEVVGARYLDPDDLVRRLGLRRGGSTLDPLAPVARAAAAIHGVMSVQVERRLPGTIRVIVREARPVALAAATDRLVLIDSTGRMLPYDPARAPASLPISERDSTTASLLQRLAVADPVWYDSVEFAHRDRGDVVLDAGVHRVRLRPDAGADVLRAVLAVRTYLTEAGIAWRELDGRFRDRVFVRKAGA